MGKTVNINILTPIERSSLFFIWNNSVHENGDLIFMCMERESLKTTWEINVWQRGAIKIEAASANID